MVRFGRSYPMAGSIVRTPSKGVIFDAKSNISTGAGSSWAVSQPIAGNLILACASGYVARTLAITCGGVTMTPLAILNIESLSMDAYLYGLFKPPTGPSVSIQATASGGTMYGALASFSVLNAQGLPTNLPTNQGASAGTASLTVAAAGQQMGAFLCVDNNSSSAISGFNGITTHNISGTSGVNYATLFGYGLGQSSAFSCSVPSADWGCVGASIL